jgi:hypothetical protein
MLYVICKLTLVDFILLFIGIFFYLMMHKVEKILKIS